MGALILLPVEAFSRVRYDASFGNLTYAITLRMTNDGYAGSVTIVARNGELDRNLVLALIGRTARALVDVLPGNVSWSVEPTSDARRVVRRSWSVTSAHDQTFDAITARVVAGLPQPARRAITLYYEEMITAASLDRDER